MPDKRNVLFNESSHQMGLVGFDIPLDVGIFFDVMKMQTWYGTTGDMEHLRRFWHTNFGKRTDFKPNYIVPNMSSIIRCLSAGTGVAVVPDFLSKKELDSGTIQLIWEGNNVIENTLYFGTRKRTHYAGEIRQIQEIFEKEMEEIDLNDYFI